MYRILKNMPLEITKCEVDKENQISPSFDVIILGKENLFFNQTLNALQNCANHFAGLKIGYCYFTEKYEIEIILHKGHASGMIFIVIDDMNTFSSKVKATFEEVAILSNTVVLQNFNFNTVNYIGFQRHLVSLEDITYIEERSKYATSLGLLVNDINNLEPELREVQHLFVNLNICKGSYFPCVVDALPTGLDPESLMQLIRFSTNSPDLKTIVFNIENISSDKDNKAECLMVAECIWYLLEGINLGPIVIDENCETTFCTLKEHDMDLEFLYSNPFNKYWVRMFDQANDTSFVACTESEYTEGCQGQISNRLFKKFFTA